RAPRDHARSDPVLPAIRSRAVGETACESGAAAHQKKARPRRPCFSNTNSLNSSAGEARPSVFRLSRLLAEKRLRVYRRAWSDFLPRLGPGPISTRNSEIATGPDRSRVVRAP